VGRAKLREVMSHPEAYKLDERTTLYLHALRLIDETKPLAVMIENVPDILNQGGRAVGDEIAEHLVAMGYSAAYTLMNATNYGVPQMRDRFFLMAYANELGVNPTFPPPTHWVQMPSGYQGSRDVALKLLGDLDSHPNYRPPATPCATLPPAVTSMEAIGDLPAIYETQKRGARRFDQAVPHPECSIAQNSYAATMRNWPTFESTGELWDHVTRSLGQRDLRLFAQMEAGDEYPAAHRLALRLWRNAGAKPKDLRTFVPPYDPGKFPNKWRKMEPDAPARTLMAHLGKDTYSHIHYNSGQARTITVREAARLQSFPDGFRFAGTMNPAFRQIGNAVPPLLAFHLAGSMMSALSRANFSLQERSSA
jgi:DNA (cytosine-5)-methyltransferase 1